MRLHLPRFRPAPRPDPLTPAECRARSESRARADLLDALVRVPVNTTRLRAFAHDVVPNLMRAAFPKPGMDADLSDLTVYRAVGYCLDKACANENGDARAALQRRVHELERAGVAAVALRGPASLEAIVRAHVLAPLRQGKCTLLPGGFLRMSAAGVDGHAVALYLCPGITVGTTRAFACDRVAGKHPYLLRDGRGHRLPLVWDAPTDALVTPAAARRWRVLMQLQRHTAFGDSKAFYEALTALFEGAGGTLRLGKQGHARVHDVWCASQSVQKSGTCSWHSTWAYLRVALQADLGDPPTSWSAARVTALYKRVKRSSRAQIKTASLSPKR